MAVRTITIEGIGDVKLVKSSSNRSIRLSVNAAGVVRVSMPFWTPYGVGASFAAQHREWIRSELAERVHVSFEQDQKVGKLHHLDFVHVPRSETISTRVTATKVIIKLHPTEEIGDNTVQQRAHKAVIRALKKEADQLLPPRVTRLANEYGFSFSGISAKQLKRRWGSCDSHHQLVFNVYLMELPWELIDYVILHELTHTRHLHHGPAFWAQLKAVCPRALDLRRQIKQYQPIIQAS